LKEGNVVFLCLRAEVSWNNHHLSSIFRINKYF